MQRIYEEDTMKGRSQGEIQGWLSTREDTTLQVQQKTTWSITVFFCWRKKLLWWLVFVPFVPLCNRRWRCLSQIRRLRSFFYSFSNSLFAVVIAVSGEGKEKLLSILLAPGWRQGYFFSSLSSSAGIEVGMVALLPPLFVLTFLFLEMHSFLLWEGVCLE